MVSAKRAVIAGFLAVGTVFLSAAGAHAQLSVQWPIKKLPVPEGIFMKPHSANLFNDLSRIEHDLYNRTYADESTYARLKRIEVTLFGASRYGNSELRYQEILKRYGAREQATSEADHAAVVDYLEQRFFQQSFNGRQPFEQRVRNLEREVFGESPQNMPMQARLQKLTYTVPLEAREIRLTKTDKAGNRGVVATTGNVAGKGAAYALNQEPQEFVVSETIQAEPAHGSAPAAAPVPSPSLPVSIGRPARVFAPVTPVYTMQSAPSPVSPVAAQVDLPIHKPSRSAPHAQAADITPDAEAKIQEELEAEVGLPANNHMALALPQAVEPSSGKAVVNYLTSIYRPREQALRWNNLPVRVAIRTTEPADRQTVAQALALWAAAVPLEEVAASAEADIVLDWDQVVQAGPITRPIIHLDQQRRICNIIYVAMNPYRNAGANEKLRATLHQLGHALGLWGHSDQPTDILYPLYVGELSDMPREWIRRSTALAPVSPEMYDFRETPRPSQRDLSTLMELYRQPARDLKFYSP